MLDGRARYTSGSGFYGVGFPMYTWRYDNAQQAVVAKFDESYTITLSNWTLWYAGFQYIYSGASTRLEKQ